MNSEKNIVFFIVITAVIIIGYPLLLRTFFPGLLPTAGETPVPEYTIRLDDEQTAQRHSEADKYSNDDSKQQDYRAFTLRNEEMTITVEAPGGYITRVDLNTINDPKTSLPTVVVNHEQSGRGIFKEQGFLHNTTLVSAKQIDLSSVLFTYEGEQRQFKKYIQLGEQPYTITVRYEVEDISDWPRAGVFELIAASGIKTERGVADRYNKFVTFLTDKKKLRESPIGALTKNPQVDGNITFSGIKTQYFSIITAPGTNTVMATGRKTATADAEIVMTLQAPTDQTTLEAVLYVGPSIHALLAAPRLGFEEVRGRGFFAGLSEVLMLLLHTLYKLFRNYGLAVIALSLIINGALSPLTIKSYRAMKDMQKIQPLMDALREQYKDNQQKLNKELMELYRKHKINPAGGCLPLLLQLPVFFSLYNVLMNAIELRGAGFLWIGDLSAPDALFALPEAINSLPLIGNFMGGSFNILPLLMIGLQVLQQKVTTPTITNEQQRIMAKITPIMFGVLFYGFPSGLVLYFLTNSVFAFFIQLRIAKTT